MLASVHSRRCSTIKKSSSTIVALKTIQQYQIQHSSLESSKMHFEVQAFQIDSEYVAQKEEQTKHFKIFWIEDGSGAFQVDFQSFSIKKSGLFFLSPGQVLKIKEANISIGYQITFNKEFYCVETHGKEIACNGVLFNNVYRAAMITVDVGDIAIFRQIMDNMLQELQHPGPAHQDMLETYMRMLLIQALRKLEEQPEPVSKITDESNRLVSDFIALVDKHFRTIHSVAEYAEMLFVSPKSLAKRLKALNYPTPTEMIRERIILQAKRELRYSDKSVKEIAFELGFEDPAYFTRLFKKAEKDSPQTYRSNYLDLPGEKNA